MAQKKINYTKEKTIHNGTTTIVYGTADYVENTPLVNKMLDVYKQIHDTLSCYVEKRGISRLHPLDQYDEKRGNQIASYKSEINCISVIQKDLCKLLKASVQLTDVINESLDEFDRRVLFLQDKIDNK